MNRSRLFILALALVGAGVLYIWFFTRFILRPRAGADAVNVFFREDVVSPGEDGRINVNVFVQPPSGRSLSGGTVTLGYSPQLLYVQPRPDVEDSIEQVCVANGFLFKQLVDVLDDGSGTVVMTRVALDRDENLPSPQFCYSTFTFRVRDGQSVPADGASIVLDEKGKFDFVGPEGSVEHRIDPARNRVVVRAGGGGAGPAGQQVSPAPTSTASGGSSTAPAPTGGISLPNPTSSAPLQASPTPGAIGGPTGGFSCVSCPARVGLSNLPLVQACAAAGDIATGKVDQSGIFNELRECVFNPRQACTGAWDINGDGRVNAADFSAFTLCCGCQRAPSPTPTKVTPRITSFETPIPLPPERACQPLTQPCQQITTPFWYFSERTGSCVQPLARCGGTRFASKVECEAACHVAKEPSPTVQALEPTQKPQSSPVVTAPVGPACQTRGTGDCDCDGATGIADFECWRAEFVRFAEMGSCDAKADFDADGACRLSDFEIFRVNFE